jgi:hypothetical protein
LKENRHLILDEFNDTTPPSECVVFYRPSFGRRGGPGSQFGEFDGILVSAESVYLIESKWRDRKPLRPEQRLRHQVLTWYILNWKEDFRLDEFDLDWEAFREEKEQDFQLALGKTIPRSLTHLAKNLGFVLNKIVGRCREINDKKIRNVLLFFHEGEKQVPDLKEPGFSVINIDYSEYVSNNFVVL